MSNRQFQNFCEYSLNRSLRSPQFASQTGLSYYIQNGN